MRALATKAGLILLAMALGLVLPVGLSVGITEGLRYLWPWEFGGSAHLLAFGLTFVTWVLGWMVVHHRLRRRADRKRKIARTSRAVTEWTDIANRYAAGIWDAIGNKAGGENLSARHLVAANFLRYAPEDADTTVLSRAVVAAERIIDLSNAPRKTSVRPPVAGADL